MKTKTTLTILLITILAVVFNYTEVHSNRSSPPSGSAGEPADNQTCARQDCHPGPAQSSSLDNLLLTIEADNLPTDTLNIANPTFKYQPNTDYNISFLLNSFTGRYGFQIIALNSSNQRAGTFTVTDNINTQINSLGNRQYMGHKGANTYKNWQFRWTSPASTTGPVTFYYAYNTSNADDEKTGDAIYSGSVTISPDLSVKLPDLNNALNALNVFPNPVDDELRLSFSLSAGNHQITSSIYTMEGKMVKSLLQETLPEGHYSRNFRLMNLPAGIYLLKIDQGALSSVRKIVKL